MSNAKSAIFLLKADQIRRHLSLFSKTHCRAKSCLLQLPPRKSMQSNLFAKQRLCRFKYTRDQCSIFRISLQFHQHQFLTKEIFKQTNLSRHNIQTVFQFQLIQPSNKLFCNLNTTNVYNCKRFWLERNRRVCKQICNFKIESKVHYRMDITKLQELEQI